MSIFDRNNVLSSLHSMTSVVLELGCGNRKHQRHAIGIDLLDYPEVDIVGDIYESLASFPAKSVDSIYAYHFIEHVPDVPRLLSAMARVLKKNGCIELVAPHFSNPYFYSDPTHKSFFGLYTFCYYANHSPFKREVPTYGYTPLFHIQKVDLIFKGARPFIFRYGIKRIFGLIFNSCNYMKELYEDSFCYVFPCYEVRYVLRCY